MKSGLPMRDKPLLIFHFILSAEPLSFICPLFPKIN
jgi:hypothetical protein